MKMKLNSSATNEIVNCEGRNGARVGSLSTRPPIVGGKPDILVRGWSKTPGGDGARGGVAGWARCDIG